MEGLRGVPLEAWDGFGSLVDAYGRPGARARVAYGCMKLRGFFFKSLFCMKIKLDLLQLYAVANCAQYRLYVKVRGVL